MRTESTLGRGLFFAAAFAFATPTVAQIPTPIDNASPAVVAPLLGDPIPEGRDIPSAEADQLRGGGKIDIALVVVKQGKKLVYKFIRCASSSDCRNAAFKRFGREAVKQIYWASGIAAAQRLACKAGIRQFC